MDLEIYNHKKFWINKIEHKEELLLTKAGIDLINKKNLNEPLNGLNNLINFPGAIDYAVVIKRTEVKKQPVANRVCAEDVCFDTNLESVFFPFEAIAILEGKENRDYYYAVGVNTAGYVLKTDVAITLSKKLWEQFYNPSDFYMVTANNIKADKILPNLYMGVKIPIDDDKKALVPKRELMGILSVERIKLQCGKGLNLGYLDYHAENIINQAFLCLGDTYGWGGDFTGRDCSSLVCEIYKTFGILVGRNVSSQLKSGSRQIGISNMPIEGKAQLISSLPVGSTLSFNGHTSIYIGNINSKPYILHALNSKLNANGECEYVRQVVVTDTDIKRVKTGYTFLESFSDMVLFC